MTDELATLTFLLDWQAAELAAVQHMRTLGFIDAHSTAGGADGGIDALSSEAAAQVKFYTNPIGRPEIQRLRGAAHEYRLALFYSTGGYTNEAVTYADQAGVSLFLMDVYGRCQPVSNWASLLVEPEHIEERRESLEELKAIRYWLAAAAFQSDLTRYREFAQKFPLAAEEAALFTYVISGLELHVSGFRAALKSKSFPEADTSFQEIQLRTALLSWITTPTLKENYANIEEASVEGWRRDTEISDHLLQRASQGVRELNDFLGKAFEGCAQYAPAGVSIDNLVDKQTVRSVGVLLVVTLDASVLNAELTGALKTSVVVGVERARQQAKVAFEHIIQLLNNAKLTDSTRSMVGNMLRAESIASRVLLQLQANAD
jgi:hypothetical protein